MGTMLKYIEWDGQSFVRGKRRAQSGSYPWPKGESGTIVEISEREFEYLLSRSIVPFKGKNKVKREADFSGLPTEQVIYELL